MSPLDLLLMLTVTTVFVLIICGILKWLWFGKMLGTDDFIILIIGNPIMWALCIVLFSADLFLPQERRQVEGISTSATKSAQ